MQIATSPTAADPFRVCAQPYDEHWQGYVLGEDATHRYLWIWMGFNIRLIAVPHGVTTGYDHAWCYPCDPEAVVQAAAEWDPETQDEPAGWHKRATWPARRAPRRDPAYRPRCVHGCRIGAGCRTLDCPDQAAR